MAFKLSEFSSAFKGGGARSSLFEVSLSGSAPAGNLSNLKFLCRATTIPPSNIAPIDVPFLGRAIKVAGDRTFEPWSITILNDEDFAIRNVLERWMDQIKSHQGIKQSRSSISGYQRNLVLTQYTKNGKKSHQYMFVNAWPSSVSEIPLAWDAPAVEEFTCTWNYDYWKSSNIPSPVTVATEGSDDEEKTRTYYPSPTDIHPDIYTPSRDIGATSGPDLTGIGATSGPDLTGIGAQTKISYVEAVMNQKPGDPRLVYNPEIHQ